MHNAGYGLPDIHLPGTSVTEAAEAGATIVKEAQEIFFGRHGFFADLDGFLWEVAWNPSFPMGSDGSIELPD